MVLTYKFRMYETKRNRHLHQRIDIAGLIWNHCLALQKRYYGMTGKYISAHRMKTHLTKLKKTERFAHFTELGSQAVQDVAERQDKAYQRFFKWVKTREGPRCGPPTFKKVKKYKSFTLKQAGWKLLEGNKIRIQGRVYKFAKSREIEGCIKTVTVKRDCAGDLWLCFSVRQDVTMPEVAPSHIAGFDFGLKTFLTVSDGTTIKSPQFLHRSLNELAVAQRSLSRKQRGSRNWREAKRKVARIQRRVADRRRDWFFKLAHDLTDRYDVLVFETLNLKAFQRLWGRKVSDLAFAEFLSILQWIAARKGNMVHFVSRWFPSSKLCNTCGCMNDDLHLEDRRWRCDCGAVNDRDLNASLNIEMEGASSIGLEGVRLASVSGPCLKPESHER